MSFINVDVFIRSCLTYNIHVKKYRKTRNVNTIWNTDQVSRTNFGIHVQDFSLILKFVPFRITFFLRRIKFLEKKNLPSFVKMQNNISQSFWKEYLRFHFYFFLHTIVTNIFLKIITITLFLLIFYKEITCMISCRLKTRDLVSYFQKEIISFQSSL